MEAGIDIVVEMQNTKIAQAEDATYNKCHFLILS